MSTKNVWDEEWRHHGGDIYVMGEREGTGATFTLSSGDNDPVRGALAAAAPEGGGR